MHPRSTHFGDGVRSIVARAPYRVHRGAQCHAPAMTAPALDAHGLSRLRVSAAGMAVRRSRNRGQKASGLELADATFTARACPRRDSAQNAGTARPAQYSTRRRGRRRSRSFAARPCRTALFIVRHVWMASCRLFWWHEDIGPWSLGQQMQRRTFSREFKIEAVKLVTERGVAVAQACRELELSGERAAAVDARAGGCCARCVLREVVRCRASRDRHLEEGARPSQGGACILERAWPLSAIGPRTMDARVLREGRDMRFAFIAKHRDARR